MKINFNTLANIGIKGLKAFLIILAVLSLLATFTGAWHQIFTFLICIFLYWTQTKKIEE